MVFPAGRSVYNALEASLKQDGLLFEVLNGNRLCCRESSLETRFVVQAGEFPSIKLAAGAGLYNF
jgi:hypothetical protein